MKPPQKDSGNLYPVYVGPYKIGKTLGQGQTGRFYGFSKKKHSMKWCF